VLKAVAEGPGIQWGLEVFPYPAEAACTASPTVQLSVGADSGAMVGRYLDAISPGGNTPMAAAISAATSHLTSLSDGDNKAILLVTDGVPECSEGQSSAESGDEMEATIAAIAAAKRSGFPVYVIGAGPAAPALDALAQAGGTGTHYPARSLIPISDAIAAISGTARSCAITLRDPPPDIDNVVVYFDQQLVPKDPSNGWIYEATSPSIELTGSYCESLLTARSASIAIVFGCPGMLPPTCIP
jgi:hypothetical protein